jgi:FtsH-binding integral membrane protein
MANSTLYNKLNNINKNKINGIKGLFELLYVKKTFLLQTFGNLIFQILITFIIAFNIKIDFLEKNKLSYIGIFILLFIIIFIIALVPMPPILKFLMFCIFSVLFGLIIAFVKNKTSINIIKTALISVLAIYIIMFLLGLFLLLFNIKLGFRTGIFLLSLLFIFIISTIVFRFMNSYYIYHKIFAIIGILLFSAYIVYDTNVILQKNYFGDFITASLDYYLDIINLFINLVNFQNQ